MKKYVLFDAILDINHTAPLVTSAKELLKVLNIDIPLLNGANKELGVGYIGEDMEKFYKENAKSLALASKESSDIVCVEDSSFLSLKSTMDKLEKDDKLKAEIVAELKKDDLELNFSIDILTLADFIIKEFGITKLKKNIKNGFDKFFGASYLGSYQCQLSKYSDTNSYVKLLEATGLKLVKYDLKNQVCGYDINDTNEKISYKIAGALMLDMFDNASDFVVVNVARSFIMFDKHQKELESSVGREIGLGVFGLAEILLLAFGITDKKRIGLDDHTVKTNII